MKGKRHAREKGSALLAVLVLAQRNPLPKLLAVQAESNQLETYSFYIFHQTKRVHSTWALFCTASSFFEKNLQI